MGTTEITTGNFAATIAKPGIVLLDFWAAWCGPCRAFAPIFEAAAAKHTDIVFGKVDTEAQQDLAQAFGIRSIPTIMGFRDGVLLFAQPGMLPASAIDELIGKIRDLDMEQVRRELSESASENETGAAEQAG